MWTSIIFLSFLILFLTHQSKGLSKTSGANFRISNIHYILIVAVFALFFGFRSDFGNDYETYLYWYENGYYLTDERTEILFRIISNFGYENHIMYYWYFSVLAFLEIAFFVCLFKYDKKVLPYVFLFLITSTYTGYGINFWMNGVRQSIAMCVWCATIPLIDRKRIIPYLILCFFAIGFHKTAVLLIPFYCLAFLKKDYLTNTKLQLAIFLSVFVAKIFFESIMMSMESYLALFQQITGGYEEYEMSGMLEDMEGKSGGGLFVMIQAIIHSFIILNSNMMKDFYASKRFINIYCIYFFGLLTTFIFPEGIVSLSRPFRYFGIFQVIMLAYFCYFLLNYKQIKNGKIYAICIMALYYFMFFITQLLASPTSHLWYKTIFNS